MKNLIKIYLWPLIKRFKALFITMIVLTTIGVTSIIAFNGVSKGIKENYGKYIDKSNAPNAFISTSYPENFKEMNDELLKECPGVDRVERTFFLPCSARLKEQETKSAQIFTFDEHHDEYQPRYYEKATRWSEEYPNVCVESAFANLNNIHVGQTIEIGYFEVYLKLNVCGIVSYPDTVVYGASNAISTENTNFGRIYIEKNEIKDILSEVKEKLEAYINSADIDPATKTKAKEFFNKFSEIIEFYAENKINQYGNRLSIYFKEGTNHRETLNSVKKFLEKKNVEILESYLFDESLSATIIDSTSGAMKSAGAAVSVFVFGTTIVVLTMFLLQIIREMMRDIGVMQAIGIRKEHIMVLLAMFSLIISLIGTAFGVFFGHLIEFGLDSIVGNTFGVTVKAPPWRIGNTILAFVMVILASQFATLFACMRITKLVPVEALNDQASSKKVLPPSIDKKLQNSPPAIRLTVNSVLTKPKRFLTSFFAIFASALIIFTSCAALSSFRSALNNTFDKYIRYDAQVVFASEPGEFESELQEIEAKDYEQTRYATPVLSYKGKSETITLQGLSVGSDMVNIPVKRNKFAQIPEDGITLNMITAKHFGIKAGETVQIDGHDVKVAYVSQLEAYNVSFCSILHMGYDDNPDDDVTYENYVNNDVKSYLIRGVDKEKLVSKVTNYHYDAIVTLMADQRNYFESRFKTLEMVCVVFIIFSVGLGMLIVALMEQTSLIEQKRDLCIMRSVGFSMSQISWLWSTISAMQFILAMLFAIPFSFLATKIFLSITSTKMAMVLSYAGFKHVLITSGLVVLFLLIAHFFCMGIVKRLNIADNTKSRE